MSARGVSVTGTTRLVKHVLGAMLLGGLGGAMFAALIGLIFADLLAFWDRGSVVVAATALGGLTAVTVSLHGAATDPIEDDA